MARYPVTIQLLFSKPSKLSVMLVSEELTIVTSKFERKKPIRSLSQNHSEPLFSIKPSAMRVKLPYSSENKPPSCRIDDFTARRQCPLSRPLFITRDFFPRVPSSTRSDLELLRDRFGKLDMAGHGRQSRPSRDPGCVSSVGDE